MPTLMLRGLPADLVARLRAYAARKEIAPREAAERLIDAALRAHERAVTAGTARGAHVTTDSARAAVQARWARRDA